MLIDLVMLVNSKNRGLIEMTSAALDSLRESENPERIRFNVIVMESDPTAPNYHQADVTVCPDVPFNYHRFCNIGLTQGSAPFVVLANNDVIWKPGWMTAILQIAADNLELGSFSPWCDDPWPHGDGDCHIGYGVGGVVTGWCLVARRQIFEKVRLREEVNFWCSDNSYQDELIKHGIKHALVRRSRVIHLGGRTLFSEPDARIHELTAGQVEIYGRMEK